MHMKPVKSSMISHVGYDAASKTLHVQFPGGSTYEYRGVEPEQHTALMDAKSIGKHFASHVRGKFDHRMLGDAK